MLVSCSYLAEAANSSKKIRKFPGWFSDFVKALRSLRLPPRYKVDISYYRADGGYAYWARFKDCPRQGFDLSESFIELKSLTKKQRKEEIKKIIRKIIRMLHKNLQEEIIVQVKIAKEAIELIKKYAKEESEFLSYLERSKNPSLTAMAKRLKRS
jgi:hypothetical protein